MAERENMSVRELLVAMRDEIDNKHEEALRALEAVEQFLIAPVLSVHRASSYRQKVLQAVDNSWRSVDELAECSGVSVADTRGVLYAPACAASLQRTKKNGRAMFRRRLGPEGADGAASHNKDPVTPVERERHDETCNAQEG